MNDGRIKVRFWGVRGSIPTPGADTVRYGGNTSCVEVRCGERIIILDGGTGLRGLGINLTNSPTTDAASLFLSHLHWDHIQGIPFFAPLAVEGYTLDIYGPHKGSVTLAENLERQMGDPYFPVPLTAMKSEIRFHEVSAGEVIHIGRVDIKTASLRHPGGAMGFRIEHEGASVAYCCDHEHIPGQIDANVLALAAAADLLIFDATYTDEDFKDKVGWGHSTWQHACKVAATAKVRRLVLTHHEPGHDDDFMDGIEVEAQKRFEATVAAKEGMEIEL